MPDTPNTIVAVSKNPLHLNITAFIILCSALLVIVGWLTKNNFLVQIQPSFETIKFNTAFLMIFGAFGLYFINTHRHISGMIGIFITFFAGLTEAQNIFGKNFGID